MNSDLPIAATRKKRKISQNRNMGYMASKRGDSSVDSTPKGGFDSSFQMLVVAHKNEADNIKDEKKVENSNAAY